MPRNGSGSYSLPEAAFIPNTAISSAAMNSDLSDIGAALTGSLARDGQGGMTAVLPLANTGFTYLSDPNTGIRRTASDTQAISGGGVDSLTVSSTGVSIVGTLAVGGAFTVGGAPLLPVGLGPLPWSGTVAPSKWILCYGQTLVRATYPDLWLFASAEIALGNTLFTNGDGSTTFTICDLRGRFPAGRDNMGGTPAGRLTDAVSGFGDGLGEAGGAQTQTLTLSQIPTGITSVNASQSISVNANNFIIESASGTAGSAQPGGTQNSFPLASSTAAKSFSSGNNSISVTSNNTSGTAHGNVQPTIITNYIIYAGA